MKGLNIVALTKEAQINVKGGGVAQAVLPTLPTLPAAAAGVVTLPTLPTLP